MLIALVLAPVFVFGLMFLEAFLDVKKMSKSETQWNEQAKKSPRYRLRMIIRGTNVERTNSKYFEHAYPLLSRDVAIKEIEVIMQKGLLDELFNYYPPHSFISISLEPEAP